MDTDYARVASAIAYLTEHRDEQPSLDRLAASIGLSPFHFQRTFRKYAGVTPKQFLAALTLESAKALLSRDVSVADAALDVGLSGSSRLHDHFVSIEAMSPGEYKTGGEGLRVTYGFTQTPFGLMLVATTTRGIAMLEFVDSERDFDPKLTEFPRARFERDDTVADRLAPRIFGEGASGPMRVHVRGTNFQLRVWNALLNVPEGAVRTYGQLAASMGEPNSARAVGNALAHNPVALLIPCHRVIASNGIVGSYKWSSARKRALLAWETARTG
jgi:AraC family transcriptional regulator, regulatory protein of adaptative response / methylated-DNA-[protein]-cysteine methyltransferase